MCLFEAMKSRRFCHFWSQEQGWHLKFENEDIKFSFPEKATKMCTIVLHGFEIYLVNVKTMRMIAPIFVAFSEKLNFKETEEIFFRWPKKVMGRCKPRTSYCARSYFRQSARKPVQQKLGPSNNIRFQLITAKLCIWD